MIEMDSRHLGVFEENMENTLKPKTIVPWNDLMCGLKDLKKSLDV